MSNVLINKQKIDILANAIAAKSGEPVTMTLDEMVSAVDGIQTGGGTPTLETVTKTYTPSTSAVTDTITPSAGYDGIEEVDVTVSAIPISSSVDDGCSIEFVTSGGLRKARFTPWIEYNDDGYVAVTQGVNNFSTNIYNAVASGTTVTPTESSQTIGGTRYMMEGAVTVNAIPSNYVGSGVPRRNADDLEVVAPYFTAPSGYYEYEAQGQLAWGSATPAASISGTSATVSTGTNTLTLSKTVSNTPQVSAGYVSSGTAGNTSVSLTANVTTKAAATITPGTSNQTIASGTYLTGTQTISGDANLVAGNIKNGTTIFGVTGTYEGSSPVKTKTGTFTGNGTRTIGVTCDFEPDLVYVTSDPGTTASSGTVAFIIARDMMAATRYRNNSTTNSHYAVTPCVNLNTSGSSYSWRATYASGTVTLYCFSNNARTLLTNGRTYTYQFVKWTT